MAMHDSEARIARRGRCAVFWLAMTIFVAGVDGNVLAEETADKKPAGVMVFIADDQGYGDMGCYGHPTIRTPHLDALAISGMRFDRAFLTISSCSPSRSSILTGRYPHSTGAEDLHTPLPADQKTMAAYLHSAGFYCAAIGKWHLGEAERNHWDTVVECNADVLTEKTLEVFRNRPADKPFFFWVASKDPHRPFQKDTLKQPHKPSDVTVPPYLPDHPLIRQDMAMYYDEITRFDACVGSVLKAVEGAGLTDSTMVAYLSDNGMPFPRAKTTLYESGIRTPLVIRWPGVVPRKSVQTNLFSVVDLAPTILAACQVKQDTMQGTSQLAMLRDEKAAGRKAIFAEANWHDFEKFTRAVRNERFKLVRNYYWDTPLWNSVDSIHSITWKGLNETRQQGKLTTAQAFLFRPMRPYEELYDLKQDPHELKNVIGNPKYREALWRLRAELDNWRVATGDVMPKKRRRDGWSRDGKPLPHNQPWYDRWKKSQSPDIFK